MRRVVLILLVSVFLLFSHHNKTALAEDPWIDNIDETVEQHGDQRPGILPEHWVITSHTAYADVVLDYDENITSKVIDQLIFRKSNTIKPGKIYISGIFKGSHLSEWTETADAFPILTRFPDRKGTSEHEFVTDNAALAFTATPGDWITLFAQVEFHELRFDGQAEFQLRKVYATIGDLNRTPFYATIGRKTINFGDFDHYSPFTHNINNHFFRAEADDPIAEFGYVGDIFRLSATAISGGRHLRTADTSNEGKIDNFAIDAEVHIPIFSGSTLKLGGGYLHGTIYNHTLPHHPGLEIDCPVAPGQQGVPKCRGRNGAFDVRAEFNSPMFDLMAEYTQTIDPWPATDQELNAFTIQGRLKTEIFDRKTHFSVSYSRADIGPFSTGGPGAPIFDGIDQLIAGTEIFLNPNFSVAIEYSHNTGFAPLVNITAVANEDAKADQLIVGGRVVF